jgi:hypothetical protein
VYQAGKDYAAAVSEYKVTLGPSDAREVTDSAGSEVERVIWQDERTRFELRRVSSPSDRTRVSSTLGSREAERK